MTKLNKNSGNSLAIVLIIVLVALVTIGGAAAWYFFLRQPDVVDYSPQPQPTTNQVPAEESSKASPITSDNEIQKLDQELSTLVTDDTSETLTNSDTTGL